MNPEPHCIDIGSMNVIAPTKKLNSGHLQRSYCSFVISQFVQQILCVCWASGNLREWPLAVKNMNVIEKTEFSRETEET